MCLHRSYIIVEDGRVLSVPDNDHHTNIRLEHKIREEGLHATIPHAAVEYRPVSNLFDLKSWEFHVDEKAKPNWLKKEHQDRAYEILKKEHMRYASTDSTYVFPGALDLNELTRLEPNTTIVADQEIMLDNLEYIPQGVVLVAKKNGVSLYGLRDIHPTATIIAPTIRGSSITRHIGQMANTVTDIDMQKKRHSKRRPEFYYGRPDDSELKYMMSMPPKSISFLPKP